MSGIDLEKHKNASGFEDSDDEADEALPKPSPSNLIPTAVSCPSTFHEIVVTYTAFTGYRAVIGWLNTSFIDSADLSPPPSAAPLANPAAGGPSKAVVTAASETVPYPS